jgi:PadR family transcriptional regulator, regulatory protein PadR
MYKRKILQAFVQIHLLYHASEQQGIYGVQMIEELSRHGYCISPGTLYPILHKMKNDNILSMKTKNVNGKIRKIYSLTPKGKVVLDDLKAFITELYQEVI